MQFFEKEPRFKVGPFNIGKKPGREITGPSGHVTVQEEHLGLLGYAHPVYIIVKNPDQVRIDSGYSGWCKKCTGLSSDLLGDQVKKSSYIRRHLVIKDTSRTHSMKLHG